MKVFLFRNNLFLINYANFLEKYAKNTDTHKIANNIISQAQEVTSCFEACSIFTTLTVEVVVFCTSEELVQIQKKFIIKKLFNNKNKKLQLLNNNKNYLSNYFYFFLNK